MRKSVLAMAAVAAMGVAGAANAGWFVVSSSSASGSGVTVTGAVPNPMNIADTTYGITADGSNTQKVLTLTQMDDILTGIGTLSANRLTYFGFEGGPQGPGFFGFAFKANGAGMSFNINLNAEAGFAGGPTNASGVYVGTLNALGTAVAAPAGGSYDAGDRTYSDLSPVTLAADETMLVLFAGLTSGSQVAGNVGRTNSTFSAFAIDYLNWNGSSFDSVEFATGASASQLNVAVYTIPVPAPVLLAGAGLIGAAALRRRMVKKA